MDEQGIFTLVDDTFVALTAEEQELSIRLRQRQAIESVDRERDEERVNDEERNLPCPKVVEPNETGSPPSCTSTV